MAPRERYIAIAAGAVIGLLALDSLVVEPLIAERAAAQTLIARDTDALQRAAGLRQNALRAAKRWNEITGQTLKSDAASAENQLVNRVRDVAQTAGLQLDTLKPERSEKEKDFQRISIRATANGTTAQAKRFLDALRTTDIPLRINDVTLASRKDGTDDIALQVGISTIYEPPAAPKGAPTR